MTLHRHMMKNDKKKSVRIKAGGRAQDNRRKLKRTGSTTNRG